MHGPLVIEPFMQKDVWDCSIACLSMLLGVPYSEVTSKINVRAAQKRNGISVPHIRRIATLLGKPLVWSETVDEDDIGILSLVRGHGKHTEGHVVIYVRDTVYNPAQGEWWTDADAFCTDRKWRVEGIFKLKEQAR